MAKLSASSEEIASVLAAMEPVIGQFPQSHVYIACLALSFIISKPDLTSESLRAGVSAMSDWLTDYLSGNLDGVEFIPE